MKFVEPLLSSTINYLQPVAQFSSTSADSFGNDHNSSTFLELKAISGKRDRAEQGQSKRIKLSNYALKSSSDTMRTASNEQQVSPDVSFGPSADSMRTDCSEQPESDSSRNLFDSIICDSSSVNLTEQEQQQCDQFLNLSLDQDPPEGVSENLSFSFAEAVDASAEAADDSVLSLKAKKKQNNSLRPEIANRSVAGPFIIRDKSLKKIKIEEINRTQRGQLRLIARFEERSYAFSVAARGVSCPKKHLIRWRCSDRSCKSNLVTKIPADFIQVIPGPKNRNNFRVNVDRELKVENLDVHDSNLKTGVHHSCSQILDKTMVGSQLANEMQKIVQNLPEDANIRPRELITQASEAVVSSLKKQNKYNRRNKINMKMSHNQRKAALLLKKYRKTLPDFNKSCPSKYVLPERLGEGNYKIDFSFAKTTKNQCLLFVSDEVQWLTGKQCTLVCDSTFPLKQNNGVFLQMWILLGIADEGTQILAFSFMARKRTSDYTDIIERLREHHVNGPLQVKKIICDHELAQKISLRTLFEHDGYFDCLFHTLQKWKRRYNGKVKKLMPARRKKPITNDEKIVHNTWHHTRMVPYMPHHFGVNYIDLLVMNADQLEDNQTEMDLKAILNWIKEDFKNHPTMSWFGPMTVGASPVWVDATTNRLERLNAEVKTSIENHCKNKSSIIEIILSAKDYCEKHYNRVFLFDTRTPNRKPSLYIRDRRAKICELLTHFQSNDYSLNRQRAVENLINDLNL